MVVVVCVGEGGGGAIRVKKMGPVNGLGPAWEYKKLGLNGFGAEGWGQGWGGGSLVVPPNNTGPLHVTAA